MLQITKTVIKQLTNAINFKVLIIYVVGYLRKERVFIKNPAHIAIKHFSTGFKRRTINFQAVNKGIFHPA